MVDSAPEPVPVPAPVLPVPGEPVLEPPPGLPPGAVCIVEVLPGAIWEGRAPGAPCERVASVAPDEVVPAGSPPVGELAPPGDWFVDVVPGAI